MASSISVTSLMHIPSQILDLREYQQRKPQSPRQSELRSDESSEHWKLLNDILLSSGRLFQQLPSELVVRLW
jgi:hypothetical protein